MFRKRWFRILFMHRFYIAIALLLQMLFMLAVILGSGYVVVGVRGLFFTVSLLAALDIVGRKCKGAYKLSWIFFVLLFPVCGGLMYYLLMRPSGARRCANRLQMLAHSVQGEADGICKDAITRVPAYAPLMRYLKNRGNAPIFEHTKTQYFSSGEEYYASLLSAVRAAKHYVFLEYFIVQEGQMWNSILDVLFEKVRSGVQVRLIYDDLGCFFLLPKDYAAFLEKNGIRTCVFNPFRPFLSSFQNNRDHRKIAVIDGKIAFTGGINMADEYINAVEKYGHWKDAGVRLEGAGAWQFTVLFLQMWSLCSGEALDCMPYRPNDVLQESDGLVAVYDDMPGDVENVCEHIYLKMIGNAKRSVYIVTPYLMVDEAMHGAMCMAAKSGVEVKVLVPHTPDKRWVHFTTRSYYRELLNAGVQIYEYTAGFVHAKTVVCDGEIASIGTANMDFRSLYLQFECGVWMYKSSAVRALESDFKETIRRCKKIESSDCSSAPLIQLLEEICRLFAPLM